MAGRKKSVLFVCLGNICRSPIAEAAFSHLIKEKELTNTWSTDSAATAAYHIGKNPDHRARNCMAKHSVEMNHRARLLTCLYDLEQLAKSLDFTQNMVLKKNYRKGIFLLQVCEQDFVNFDYIFGMDEDNISDLKEISPKGMLSKIRLLGEYDPEGELIVRDPYYDSGAEGFEEVFQQCMRCLKAFLEKEN